MILEFEVDQFDICLSLKIKVDESKFTEAEAKECNMFWSNHSQRLEESGSHRMAALKLYAAECFQLASFNNFIDAEWVMQQFDYENGKGVEGFTRFEDCGLKLLSVDNFHFDAEIINQPKDVEWGK